MINLFKRNIESRRDEILREYKQAELAVKEAEDVEELGRGHRASHKPTKFVDDKLTLPKRRQKRIEESFNTPVTKDKDGYAIPAIPTNRKKTVPSFNPEDSFDEEDDHSIASVPLNKSIKTPKIVSSSSSSSSKGSTSEPNKKPLEAPAAQKSSMTKRTKFDPPRFNPEDSFASSEDDDEHEQTLERKVRQKSPKRRIANKKVTFGGELAEEEDYEDPDYQADGDASDDDDDEDLGEVDKEELVQLYKDQAIPPEEFIAPEYSILTRSQTMAAAKDNMLLWKARFRQFGYVLCGVYMFIALICLGITAYARQKNGYCQSSPNIVTEKPGKKIMYKIFQFDLTRHLH